MCGHCLGGYGFVHDGFPAPGRGLKGGVCPADKVAEQEINVVENIQQIWSWLVES